MMIISRCMSARDGGKRDERRRKPSAKENMERKTLHQN